MEAVSLSDLGNVNKPARIIYERKLFQAFSTYTQQMILVGISYLEDIVSNFLECLLFRESSSFEKLQGDYLKSRMISKKIALMMSIVEGEKLTVPRSKELAKIIELRNSITHHSPSDELVSKGGVILPEDVEEVFTIITELNIELCVVARFLKVPIGLPADI